MTQRNRGRGLPRRSSVRRKTSWLQSAPEFLITAAAAPILAFDLTPPPMRDAVGSTEGSATIRRLILSGTFGTVIDTAAFNHMAMGLYVVNHEGFVQTAFSDPMSDEGQDWYYWTLRSTASLRATQWEADIRTARRLRAGYKLIVVVNNPLNPVPTQLNLGIRSLWTQEV